MLLLSEWGCLAFSLHCRFNQAMLSSSCVHRLGGCLVRSLGRNILGCRSARTTFFGQLSQQVLPLKQVLYLAMFSGVRNFAGLILTEGLLFAGQRPEELFLTAIDILEAKCDKLLESL